MSTPRRVIGYVRLSRAAVDSTSIAKQREILAKTCEARGWLLVDTVEDPDVSASLSRLNRPGLTEVRTRIADGEADSVLVWRLDRIARSVVDFGTLLDEGLDIVSATEPLDTATPMGRAMAEILQVFAALEAKTTGERLKATKAYLRSIRRWTGGPRPYGYVPVPAPDGVGKILTPVPEEAEVVARIADEIVAGRSLYSVAVRLNEDGVPSAKGGHWTAASVRNLIRSEHVLGRQSYAPVKGSRARRPVLDGEGVPVVAWTPLLDLETAERARALTEPVATPGRSEATIAGRRKRASRLLSGLLACSCGAPLVVRRRQGVAYYGCAFRATGRAHEGTSLLVEAERVEEEVERQFLGRVGHLPVVEEIVRRPAVAGLAEVERDLAEASAEISTASSADLPGLFERISLLSARREALSALPSEPSVEFVETGETFRVRWERVNDPADRRRLLVLSGTRVAVLPARRRGFWDASRVEVSFPVDYASEADYGSGGSLGPSGTPGDAGEEPVGPSEAP